jgi:hypothetical protein
VKPLEQSIYTSKNEGQEDKNRSCLRVGSWYGEGEAEKIWWMYFVYTYEN